MRAPSDVNIPLVFAKNLNAALSAGLRSIVIVAPPETYSGWNDFGYRFQNSCHFIKEDGSAVSIPTSFMFASGKETSVVITELLRTSEWVEATNVPGTYCSLLHSEEAYRNLASELGLALAVAALRSLGDAVLLNLEGGDPEQLELIESDAFHLSMLRQNSSWTALRRGSRHLRYNPIQDMFEAASSFCMAVDLPSALNRYRIDFDFSEDRLIRDRFAVLIGKNGAGKSQLLLSLIDGMSGGALKLVPRTQRVRFKSNHTGVSKFAAPKFTRIVAFSSTESDAYPIQIAPWFDIDYQYFSMTKAVSSKFDSLTISLVDCLRDDFRTTFPSITPEPELFTRSNGRLSLLKHVLTPLGLWENLHLPLKMNSNSAPYSEIQWEGRDYVRIGHRYGEQANLRFYRQIDLTAPPIIFDRSRYERRYLSSGETAMFRFAAQAAAAAENGTLFLFDEPETHLHPHYISDFVEILHLLLVATKSIAIAATHSAFLVREAPSARVRVISIDDNRVVISKPRIQTFGASIDNISKAIFADLDTTHQYQETLKRWVETLRPDIEIEEVISVFGDELNTETLSTVRRLINSRRKAEGV